MELVRSHAGRSDVFGVATALLGRAPTYEILGGESTLQRMEWHRGSRRQRWGASILSFAIGMLSRSRATWSWPLRPVRPPPAVVADSPCSNRGRFPNKSWATPCQAYRCIAPPCGPRGCSAASYRRAHRASARRRNGVKMQLTLHGGLPPYVKAVLSLCTQSLRYRSEATFVTTAADRGRRRSRCPEIAPGSCIRSP